MRPQIFSCPAAQWPHCKAGTIFCTKLEETGNNKLHVSEAIAPTPDLMVCNVDTMQNFCLKISGKKMSNKPPKSWRRIPPNHKPGNCWELFILGGNLHVSFFILFCVFFLHVLVCMANGATLCAPFVLFRPGSLQAGPRANPSCTHCSTVNVPLMVLARASC